jgi:CheY-like chemotaxis protein
VTLTLQYKTVEAVRRDRLPDVPRGLIIRTTEQVVAGESASLWLEVAQDGLAIAANATVLWTAPLAAGALVGLEIAGASRGDAQHIEQLLPVQESRPRATPVPAEAGTRRLSVLVLQPNPVLRQVLAGTLSRFTRARRGRWKLDLEVVADPQAFVVAAADRMRHLGIMDCDGLGLGPDSVVDAVRSHDPTERLPLIVLSETVSARVQDRRTVTMRKPVAMKALMHTTGILLGEPR